MVDNVDRALDEFRIASAELSCGSSSCPHARDKGGQMVNGPCRCYPHEHPLRKFVFAATRLAQSIGKNRAR